MAYISFQPSDYFNTKLYTGNGSTQSITGVGFQPDFVWLKHRNNPTAYSHQLYDVVRGVTKSLYTNTTDAESTTADGLTSFDSDGFSLGSNVGINSNTINHVSWNWLAGGTGVSNTDGSITSTVSANTTSGFSIVQFTGTGANATVGHGLGVTPAMVIVKVISASGNNWMVWNKNFSSATDNFLRLNTTASVATISNFWSTSAPNSTTFGIGAGYDNNISGATHIAYCFAEKKGFSKFGTYVGNSPTSQADYNGAFVYTGFKPAFVILKQSVVGTVANQSWYMHDNKRTPYNPSSLYLKPDSTDIEASAPPLIDLLSNGFKINSGYSAYNDNGSTFIYMAFAESPLVTSNGLPATAR